jgi:hypothetical protein
MSRWDALPLLASAILRPQIALAAVAVGLLLLAACGGPFDSDRTSCISGEQAETSLLIEVKNRYHQELIAIPGGTDRWRGSRP